MDSNNIYVISLLEHIAYRLSPGNKEFEDWVKDFQEKHNERWVRISAAQPTEVSKEAAQPQPPQARRDEPKQEPEAGVRNTFGEKLSAAWKSKK